MNKADWVWMPHAGHFILGNDCRFRLNTCVGKYIVSTVGEYLPEESGREILAKTRGVVLEGTCDLRLSDYMEKIGYEDIGFMRKYETMVFNSKAIKSPCCPFGASDFNELDMCGYNTSEAAYQGHMKMCEKWASK